MEGQSWLCSSCGHSTASLFCTCSDREVFLCTECVSSHFQKSEGKQHVTYNIRDREEYKSPEYWEGRNARVKALPYVREGVLGSVKEVEKCIEEYSARVEEVIMALRKKKEETVAQLQRKKEDLEASLTEVETTLMDPQPVLNTPYGQLIRDSLDTKGSPHLFRYTLQLGNLDSLIHIDTETHTEITHFPCISGNSIRLYDFTSKTSSSFTIPVSFSIGASFCLLDNMHVLCLGGNPASKAVYRLSTHTQQIAPMSPLNTARYASGVVKVGLFVYVFGSCSPDLASCEKLSMARNEWSDLQDMDGARFAFQPAVLENDIYLAGSQAGTRSIQVFNVVQEVFTTLPVEMSTRLTDHLNCFGVDRDLYFLSSNSHIGKWRVGGSDMIVQPLTTESVLWSNIAGYVVGCEVLLVRCDNGALVRFNYITNSIIS